MYKFFDFLCNVWVVHNIKSDRATLFEKNYSGVFVLNTTAMGKNAVYQVSWETNVWNLSDILHEVTKA